MKLIEFIKDLDTALFLFLNNQHNSFFDVVMYWATNKYFWIPFYIFLLVVIVLKYKKKSGLIIVAVALLITLSDQLSVHLFKEVFQRYRPCYNLNIGNLVHLIDGCGGKYGFVSSHAANSFAIAMFLSVLIKHSLQKGELRNRKITTLFPVSIFCWALFVSYSRIYAGVHYPSDILGGALLGVVLGYLVARIYFYVEKKVLSKYPFIFA